MNIGLHAVSLEIETQKSGDMKHHVTSCNDELANTSETPWNIHMFDTWHTQLACNMFCFLEQDLQFIYTHQRCVLFDAEGSVRGQAGSATHNKWEDSTCSMAEQKWPRHWPYCWRWFEILLAFFFVFIESGPCVGSTAKLIENVSLTLRGRIICWPPLECRPNVYTWFIMSDLANRCYTYFTSSGVPKVRADNNQMEAWFGNFHVNIL